MLSNFSNPPQLSIGDDIKSVAEVLDPRMDIRCNDEKLHVVLRGPAYLDEEIYPSTSYGTQQATWAQNTTSISDITEKNFWVKFYVQFSFTDSLGNQIAPFGASGIPTTSVYEGPRSWPIQSVISTLQLKLNGQNFSVNPQEYLHAQLRYHVKNDDVEHDYSTFPSMEDTIQNYDNAILYGSGRNPFAAINEVSIPMSRNAMWPVDVPTAPPVTVVGSTLRYEFMEPLFISPLSVGRKMTEGLTSLNRWEVTIQWGNLSRMWSSAPTNSPTANVAVTFYQSPEVVLRFLKRTRRMELSRPMKCNYPYFRPFQFVKTNVLLPAYSLPVNPTTTSSDSIQLNQVPIALLIFLRKPINSCTFNDTDTFARITNVSVLFNGIRVLSNSNEQQLYLTAKKNGYNQSFQQWRETTGSVLMLRFGEDIGLEEGVAPGMQIQRTIQVQLQVVNLFNSQQSFDYYLLPIFGGSIGISDDQCAAFDGILTADMVARASRSPSLSYCQYKMYEELNGAGFFDKLRNIVHKGAKAVSSAARIAEAVAPQYAHYARPVRAVSDVLSRV